MTNYYAYLDAAILACIEEAQPVCFGGLMEDTYVKQEAASLELNHGRLRFGSDRKPAWRFVDARLQALRKAGKIKHQRKPEGWVIANEGVTP